MNSKHQGNQGFACSCWKDDKAVLLFASLENIFLIFARAGFKFFHLIRNLGDFIKFRVIVFAWC